MHRQLPQLRFKLPQFAGIGIFQLGLDIACKQLVQQIRPVAVDVDECPEVTLFPGIQLPVNGPFLVDFQVISIEIPEKIPAYDLPWRAFAAQGLGDKA